MGEKLFSKKNICDALGIVPATFDNWKKQGIIPEIPKVSDDSNVQEPSVLFSIYIKKIRSNPDFQNKLSSRANRSASLQKSIVFHGIKSAERKALLVELVGVYESFCESLTCSEHTKKLESGVGGLQSLSVELAVLSLLVCQLRTERLLGENWLSTSSSKIEKNCKSWLFGACKKYNERTGKNITLEEILSIFSQYKIENQDDDFAGCFYQSLLSVSEKSNKGSFYTPSALLKNIKPEPDKTVYDPCCGSGNILLNVLSKNHDTSLVFAFDIDSLALKICEVNLVMFFQNPNLQATLFERSILEPVDLKAHPEKYDFIITNPPWGARFPAEIKRTLEKQYSFLGTSESFSIALYNSYKLLKDDDAPGVKPGQLYFFLPKAFLNVATHRGIRRFLLESGAEISVQMLGSCFAEVVSEVILLNVVKKDCNKSTAGVNKIADNINIVEKDRSYSIKKSDCTTPDFFWLVKEDETAAEIIKKVYALPHTTLGKDCDFGLGIVTGNNSRFIQATKTENNEPVYRGKNIKPFMLTESSEFLEWNPKVLQQSAPEKLYRQRKIIYRFIADHIICCISEKGEITLNSANFFIPRNGYPFETIVILFNSRMYKFLYKKLFDSVKILKSHLKQLPLPVLPKEEHEKLQKLYEEIVCGDEAGRTEKIEQAEDEVERIFGLSAKDYIEG